MSLYITQSHHLEYLFAQLATDLDQHNQQAIFDLRHIVTPNPAVEQWLKQYMAQYFGICSQVYWHKNVNELQWFLYQAVAEDKDQVRKANLPRVVMKWQIYQCLLKFIQKPECSLPETHSLYAIIQRIYDDGAMLHDVEQARLKRQQMAYWLSGQVAQVFRQYLRYRPEWLNVWSNKQHIDIEQILNRNDLDDDQQTVHNKLQKSQQLEAWQQQLWAYLFAEYYQQIQDIQFNFFNHANLEKKLPSSIYLFTFLDLSRYEWYFLQRLATMIDVHIYHFSATQEYWADSVDPRWNAQRLLNLQRRLAIKNPQIDVEKATRYQWHEQYQPQFDAQVREDRHPILTRFGKQARDNFSFLVNSSGGENHAQWTDLFSVDDQEMPIFADSLLGKVQEDIFYLMNPEVNDYMMQEHDSSIQFHVCHSTLRQLEVLKEQLQLWLSQSKDHQLHDVLVLVPNIQDSEALIRSVFVGRDSPPIRMSGVVPLQYRALWQALIFPMTWQRGRFTLDMLLDWLNLTAIKQYYALADEDIERIAVLLQEAGFRRGFDAVHLQQSLDSQDQDFRYSFKYALDRLAMGIAVDHENICPVEFDQLQATHVLSYAGVLSHDMPLITKLLQIYQQFNNRRDWLEMNDKSVEQWLAVLLQEIQDLQQAGVDYTQQLQKVVKQYDRMLSLTYNYEQMTQDAQSLKSLKLPLWDILQEIEVQLESLQETIQFTGRIHFSQIGKVRPLPYKLIVLLNMDSGIFPKRDYPQAFDLLNYTRMELGDRSRLEDHQGAFLDAILQAQQQIWFFYTGFDVESGEKLDPSSILLEFQSHLRQIVCVEHQDDDPIARLHYVHTAQPFIPESYANPQIIRPKSYWFDIAQVLQNYYQPQPMLSTIDPMIITAFIQQKILPRIQHEEELITRYNLDEKQMIYLDHQMWAKVLRFPAELYLKSFNIRNLQGDKHLKIFEPLILDHLEQYQILDKLQDDWIQNPQHSIPSSEDVDIHFEPLLPVGNLKQLYWQSSTQVYQYLHQRLDELGWQYTATMQQIYQFSPHIQFKIIIPNHAQCQAWGRVMITKLSARSRFKVWLDYLLWLAWLDLGDGGQDYMMLCVCQDKELIHQGLSSRQAKHYLLEWLDFYFMGQTVPLIITADLMCMKANNKFVFLESDYWNDDKINEEGLKKGLQEWQNSYPSNGRYKESQAKHLDWQLLFYGLDHELIEQLLYKSLEQYGHLYAPMRAYQSVLKPV